MENPTLDTPDFPSRGTAHTEPARPPIPHADTPGRRYEAQPPGAPLHKTPGLAVLLSAMPGLGHVYNGLYERGTVFFALVSGAISLAVVSDLPFFGFVAFFFWCFSVLDAYRQARLINHGYATDLGLFEQPRSLRTGQGGLAVGVILILVGTLELLARFGLWDWAWLEQLWPAVLILVGIALVVMWQRERAKRSDGGSDGELEAEL